MGEIIPSESLSHVTYTGINSMHSQKTKKSYIRREKKAREKKTHEKAPSKLRKMSLKSTESLKRERPSNNPPKRTKYIKRPCKVLTTEPLKTGRPKNESELKKLTSVRIL